MVGRSGGPCIACHRSLNTTGFEAFESDEDQGVLLVVLLLLVAYSAFQSSSSPVLQR